MGWKEKPHRKAQRAKRKETEVENRDMEVEILRMQGLKECPNCQAVYSFYQPRCPFCDAPNLSFYPAKV